MVSLRTERTGVDNTIFVSTKGYAQHAPRIKIAKETTKGVNWGTGVWHKVRLERKGSGGTIKVFFDDMTKPIMIAEDTNFKSGYVGFGSFDDTGMVDEINIWGPSLETKKTEFYHRATSVQ